jgi:hypothetical protein
VNDRDIATAIGYLYRWSLHRSVVHPWAPVDEARAVNTWAEETYRLVESTVELSTDQAEFARTVRALADEDRVVADALADLGERVLRIRRHDPPPGALEHGAASAPVVGLNSMPPPSPLPAVQVSIYLSEEDGHERVEAAVEVLLSVAGLRVADREDPVIGSWFRRLRARSPVLREASEMAAHAAESRLVHAQDATITATMLQNLGPVISSLDSTREAVIRVGALLIVKADDRVVVHQLTAAQQLRLDHEPTLATAPHGVLAALGLPAQSTQDAP